MDSNLKIFSSSNITDLDATEILNKVAAYITNNNSRYKWASFYEGLAGTMTMEVMAGVAEYLLYIVERKYQELNIDTARLKSSIYMLAATKGIVPKRKRTAKGLVSYVLSRPASGPIDIDIFNGGGAVTYQGNQYVPRSSTVIPNNAVTYSVWYVQGEWVSADFNSTGLENETFLISEDEWSIDQDEFYCYYGGSYRSYAPWPNVPTADEISVKTHYSGGVLAVTGNNSIGKKFNEDDVIKFIYLRTGGAAGNVNMSNNDCAFLLGQFDTKDAAGDLTVKVYLEASFAGGKDETTADAVKNAYYDAAVNSDVVLKGDDLVNLLAELQGFDDVRMCSVGACCSMGICIVKSDESALTDKDIELINSNLSPKMTPTALPTYSTATKVPVNYTLNVKIGAGYDMANIHNGVLSYIASNIYHKLGATFDVSKYTVDIAKIEGVTGIEFSPCNSLSVECCQYIGTDNLTINVIY